jgi:uncharacterized protein YndB with AHSA1/START domain
MKHPYTATVDLHIDAPVEKVWNAIINPQMISQYLHGTNVVSDWQKGSPLSFSGIWNDKEYFDKGIILEMEKERLLSYSWLSSMSGLEDEEENYSIITYRLTHVNNGTDLKLTQQNIPNEAGVQSSEKNWMTVMKEIKKLVETKDRV